MSVFSSENAKFAKDRKTKNRHIIMNEDLSLFSAVNDEEVEQEMLNKQLQNSMSELIANRSSVMQKYAQESGVVQPENKEEEVSAEVVYTKEEIFPDVVRYFGGDELAAGVWIDKYALKNANGELVERTPEDMHRRMAREFARIERRYANPMSEEEIFGLLTTLNMWFRRAAQWLASATSTKWFLFPTVSW